MTAALCVRKLLKTCTILVCVDLLSTVAGLLNISTVGPTVSTLVTVVCRRRLLSTWAGLDRCKPVNFMVRNELMTCLLTSLCLSLRPLGLKVMLLLNMAAISRLLGPRNITLTLWWVV